MKRREQYPNPMEGELEGSRFKHETGYRTFRGQPVPSSFEFSVDENDDLEEGQVIGRSRLGQVLYWIYQSVIAKG